jgi:hypothetical protein
LKSIKGLKPGDHLIGSRVETRRFQAWLNWVQLVQPHLEVQDEHARQPHDAPRQLRVRARAPQLLTLALEHRSVAAQDAAFEKAIFVEKTRSHISFQVRGLNLLKPGAFKRYGSRGFDLLVQPPTSGAKNLASSAASSVGALEFW